MTSEHSLKEAIEFGTLSELEIMEKQTQENLKAIQDEIKKRNINNKKVLVETKVKELLNSYADKFLFLKTKRRYSGPQTDICSLKNCQVSYNIDERYLSIIPDKASLSVYHSNDIHKCNVDFGDSEYRRIVIDCECVEDTLNKIRESIKDKSYIKAYLIETFNDYINSRRQELFDNAVNAFGIEFDTNFKKEEK